MTPRTARFGLMAFLLLAGGLAMNLLAQQPSSPVSARSDKLAAAQLPTTIVKPAASSAAYRPAPASAVPTSPARAAIVAAATRDGEAAETIRAIQRELQARNYETEGITGVAGPATRAAIMAYEHDHGFALTAEANDDTLKRILLGASGDPASRSERRPAAEHILRAVKQALSELGYDGGRFDTRSGDDIHRAIRAFEKDHAMTETGRVSGGLVLRLAKVAGRPLPGLR